MKFMLSFGILLLILVTLAVQVTSAPPQPLVPGYCDPKCGVRCGLKGRESRCMKYCMMCCAKCKCVPSGTSGHKDECPCYRDWTSPNGRPKCP